MAVTSYSCDNIFPSGCVLFTADLPSFIDADDVSCNANLDEILEKTHDQIEAILSDIDLTSLTAGCLTFNPANVTIKELHQEQIDKICDHEDRIEALEDALVDFDISTKTIEVDMGCLIPLIEPCEVGAGVYTLLSVILVLKSEICALQAQLDECTKDGCGATVTCTSGTSGISGAGTSGTSGSNGTSGTSGVPGTSGTSATCFEV